MRDRTELLQRPLIIGTTAVASFSLLPSQVSRRDGSGTPSDKLTRFLYIAVVLMATLGIVIAVPAISYAQPAASDSDISRPHLETLHGVRQLVVDGKPFLILGGQLHESTPSSSDYMKPIWPRLVEENLNTVFAAVSWELIEPEEGQFDFSSVDSLIEGARQHHLHLIFLWFGSWKNGDSSYTPYWVKINPARFPLAQDRTGKNLDILSTLSAENLKADERAFAALMRHIREIDGQQHTVLMMQVENEIGIVGDSRDRSPVANAAFNKPVPEELTHDLLQHKESLAPELRESWAATGYKASGTWTDIFGPDNSLFGLDASLFEVAEQDTDAEGRARPVRAVALAGG